MRRISGEFQVNPPLLAAGPEELSQIVASRDGAFGVFYSVNDVLLEAQVIPQGDYLVALDSGFQGPLSVAYAQDLDQLAVVYTTPGFKIAGSITHEDGTVDSLFPNSKVIIDDST